ncbi:MAG: TonB-dependent receptor [Bacteroidota bacterium]
MRSLWILLSCCVFTATLLAQTEADLAALDSIYKTLELSDVVVTAQYAPTSAENAIHPIKVIKAEEMKAQGQLNLTEVLTNQLNLRVSSDPFLGNGLRIQGIGGENVQIMLDGVPMVGRLNGNIDLSQINLHNVERIEIIEGAMSALYGSNAAGGVINIITKKSQLRTFQINSSNQYESVGIWNNSLSLGASWKGFYASGAVARNHYIFAPVDSFRVLETVTVNGEEVTRKKEPWNPKLQSNTDGILRYSTGDSLSITYQYRYFEEELANYGEIRRPQFRPYAFDDYYNTERHDHSFSLEAYLGDHLYLNTTTAYNQYDRIVRGERLEIEPDTSSLVPGEQDTSVFNTLLHRTVFTTRTDTPWDGQLGFEYLDDTGQGGRIIDETTDPINASEIQNFASWLGLTYRFDDNLQVQGNLRYGYNSKYDHPWIPALNVHWQPTRRWDIKAGYARGFRAPSLKELHFNFIDINHYIIGNTNLEAEYSENASITLQHETLRRPGNEITTTLKLFYNNIDNRITIAEFEPNRFNYQNVDRFRTRGANLTFDCRWWNFLDVKVAAAYTLLHNRWADEFENAQGFTGLYEMQTEASATIPWVDTRVVMTSRYIGRQVRFYQEAEQLKEGFIGDYQLFNLTLSRRFWQDRIFVAAGAKNLWNVDRIPLTGQGGGAHSGGGGTQLIGWGRTFFVRLQYDW